MPLTHFLWVDGAQVVTFSLFLFATH
jgi:hypothetical protein